ncbi:MAG TPA: hypothetical protein VJS45_14645 [Acidimicrobiia bacterium]|nr:hypothetical protein [Acidimicrobiia bacterium]
MDATDIERLCAGSLDDLAQLLRSVAAVAGRGPRPIRRAADCSKAWPW